MYMYGTSLLMFPSIHADILIKCVNCMNRDVYEEGIYNRSNYMAV